MDFEGVRRTPDCFAPPTYSGVAFVVMRSFFAWTTRQFQKLLLLPDYFRALAKEWLNILFGETLVGVAFLLWWSLANPPNLRLIPAFIAAMFVAGYYAWRAEHIRLMPKFTIREAKIQPTETESSTEMSMFIQIIPTCLTDAPVFECRGRLLRVCHRHGNDDDWEVTRMDAPLFLGWDYYGSGPMTLESGIRQRLNVCFWSQSLRFIIPAVEPLPSKFRVVFDNPGQFKFDIRVTAKDCAPVDVSLVVELGLRKWDDPVVKLVSGGHTVRELGGTIGITET
jgi:hypothetical protein